MDTFVITYLVTVFGAFFFVLAIYFLIRFAIWLVHRHHRNNSSTNNNRNNQNNNMSSRRCDRQGNIFTISDDTTMNNRYADFFYLEPNSEEAARIRSQLDKDDKDLPTYDEVMHLSNIAAATQTSPCGAPNIGVSTTSIATTDTILTVPPYSEIDPNAITIAPVTSSSTITPNTHAAITNDTGIGTPLVAPSTSRAAATNIANTTTLTVTNSASNTSV